ncbi:MAG: translocation complex component (Npl1) [Lasallia pustulata]|uniref:Translocation complex component (Npl1) n=1 Tax=Lasallia pustulata TaxID=136370 RepID=A0A5M8PTJ4_9LECA|nr:MAG: translocation complex component (Npl1) [Lasallia pustulata]
MSTDYNYDEQGQFFPYFILTVTGLVTLPLSYTLLKASKELESTAPRIRSDFRPRDEDLIQGQKRKQWRRERRLKRIITAALGWLVMGWMIYLMMVTARSTPKIWDPYNILDISRSANEREIKSRFRRLTIQYHPDKVRLDESKNQTIESANEYYVELTKAYKALTDEEVRNNYIQYGHPDGKQSFSIGIALPKFIVTEGNGKYVLIVYGLLLGVLLPYIVGKWWYGTQRVTKEGVLVATAGNLFQEYKEDLSEGDVVTALSSGEEYKSVLKGSKADFGLGKLEQNIFADGEAGPSAAGLTPKDKENLQDLEGTRRKTLALLWAYLGRVRLDGATLDDEKYEVGALALALNEAFVAITLAFGNTLPVLSAYHTSQNLIQAIPPKASPLLQLPYLTPSLARSIEGQSMDHMTIQKFMQMSEEKRRRLVTERRGGLTANQYQTVVSVARQIPLLKVEKAFFKVMGERFITPGSLVQLVIKARFIPPGTANVPEVNELDLEDIDPDEGDLDALLGRKPAKNKKVKPLGGEEVPSSSIEKGVQPPLAHAPYLARDHSPRWHVFLADSKQGKVAVPPFTFTTFEKPLCDESGKPTFNMQTFKMQFQAPPQVGQFPFVMHLVCDSYIGIDTKMGVILKVEDSAKAVEMNDEDEISEPEEDSLAGQMNALKTGGLTGPPPKRKSKKVVEESDDESDTEGEVENTSETDTDTDTDEE